MWPCHSSLTPGPSHTAPPHPVPMSVPAQVLTPAPQVPMLGTLDCWTCFVCRSLFLGLLLLCLESLLPGVELAALLGALPSLLLRDSWAAGAVRGAPIGPWLLTQDLSVGLDLLGAAASSSSPSS